MTQNFYSNEPGHEAEETLRLVAQLPPPNDLTERVHRALDAACDAAPARRGFWSLWMPAQRLQFAGAALLVLAIAGSAWSVRHTKSGAPTMVPAVQSPGAPAFGSAAAERHPASLNPIKVPPAPKKKPSASRALVRRTPRSNSAQPSAQPATPAAGVKSPSAP